MSHGAVAEVVIQSLNRLQLIHIKVWLGSVQMMNQHENAND